RPANAARRTRAAVGRRRGPAGSAPLSARPGRRRPLPGNARPGWVFAKSVRSWRRRAVHCGDPVVTCEGLPMSTLSAVVRRVSRLTDQAAPDGELLRAFADGRDERAFAALVARHGPLVRRLARP